MKRRGRTITIQWFEPLRYSRRCGMRLLRQSRWQIVRGTVLGTLAAMTLHVLFSAVFGAPLPIPIAQYYTIAILAAPGVMLLAIGLVLVVPRVVTIQPKHVSVQMGQSGRSIKARDIRSWRIISLPSRSGAVVLHLRYNDVRGRRRKLTVGLSPKVDLLRLDHALRRMQRLDWRIARRCAPGFMPPLWERSAARRG